MKYETDKDLVAEAKLMADYADLIGCDYVKDEKPYADIDYVLLARGTKRVMAVAEAKCRYKDWTWDKMRSQGGAIIDLEKWAALIKYRMTGIQAVYIVRDAAGQIGVFRMPEDPASYISFIYAGRTDRGDPNDVGVKGLIPVIHFKLHQARSEASPGTSRPATSRSGSSRHPIEF